MKIPFFLYCTFLIYLFCQAQEDVIFDIFDFEKQILEYQPKQKQGVADKDFHYGVLIIQETKKSVQYNIENFNVSDYFNILSAFLSIGEKKKILK